jgi:tripartite-type tricarboxylate transporter receptor subunit TctC
MNQFMYRTPPYDPINDFAPVTVVAKIMVLLMVNSASDVKSVAALIAKAKAAPGTLNYGAGTLATKLTGFLFNKAAGVATTLVPDAAGLYPATSTPAEFAAFIRREAERWSQVLPGTGMRFD